MPYNSDKPLFLPDGSIRSIIAISITLVILGMYANKIPVPAELMAVWGAVVGFYFASRNTK